MRRADLHPRLQERCVPVPERSGCFAVVPLPVPTSVDVPECSALFALARREVDELSATIARNPQYADLLMGMLNRREAVDSSQIEGTHTGFDGLLLHELELGTDEAQPDSDASETFAYVRAFARGSAAVAQRGIAALDLELIRQLHSELMGGQPRAEPGAFRTVQNYIGLRLETARYVPPPASEVPGLMADLARLLQYKSEGVVETSVLMRAAIVHAQFEAIHPFLDGNGRTGRLLLPLMLQAEGLPPVHLATFLKVRQREYYEALFAAQTRLEWSPWIRLFLECIVASSVHTVQLFRSLQALQERWRGLLRGKRKNSTVWPFIDLLLGQPVVTVNQAARRLGVTFPAANDAVSELVALDILRLANAQRRHRVFHAHEVMNALYTGLDAVLDDAARI